MEPSSLRGLTCRFNRHLKACKYRCHIIEDKEFFIHQTTITAHRDNEKLAVLLNILTYLLIVSTGYILANVNFHFFI